MRAGKADRPFSPWRVAETPPALAALALVAAAAIAGSLYLFAPSDDAYVCYVYARNALEGDGFTYNGLRVEGCTSALWMGLVSVAGALGLPLPLAGRLLSTLSGVAALWATGALARSAGLAGWRALAPVALLAASGDFLFYLGSGMEQALFTALVALASALLLIRGAEGAMRSPAFASVVAAAILTRPQGALAMGLLYGWALVETRSLRIVAAGGLRAVVLLVPLLGAKWAYYGHPFPNTYYAKSRLGLASLQWGLGYVAAALPRFAPLLLLPAVGLLARRARPAEGMTRTGLVLSGLAAVWISAVALQGGDNLVGARVLVPALPWLCVASVCLVVGRASLSDRALGLATGVVAATMLAGFATADAVHAHAERWRINFPLRVATAAALRERLPDDGLVALNEAGIIPYFSRLPTLDMLGLNEPEIAHRGRRDPKLRFGHQLGDGRYVLSRRPHVILFGAGRNRHPTGFVSDREIATSPVFAAEYVAVEWPDAGLVWARRDWLEAGAGDRPVPGVCRGAACD